MVLEAQLSLPLEADQLQLTGRERARPDRRSMGLAVGSYVSLRLTMRNIFANRQALFSHFSHRAYLKTASSITNGVMKIPKTSLDKRALLDILSEYDEALR